jgi:hypothetical protein
MPARKPLSSALPPDAAAFVRGEAPSPPEAQSPPPVAAAAPAAAEEARVRFTVDLPRSLHKRLKLAALNRDEPMTELARLILTEWLEVQG